MATGKRACVKLPGPADTQAWADLYDRVAVSTLLTFTPKFREKILRSWRNKEELRWKYGLVIPMTYGVAVCLKGRALRNYVPSKVIHRYIREGG